MTHDLTPEETRTTILKRFAHLPIPASALEAFLSRGWRPSDVRDYGEVPSHWRYYEAFDACVHLRVEPTLNDHHSDTTPRRITSVVFSRQKYASSIHAERFYLSDVPPALFASVVDGLSELMKTSEYLYDGPAHSDLRLILAHGAGAPMDSPFMAQIARGVADRGVRVVRFEFPYMRARRLDGRKRGPNAASVLEASWLEVLEAHEGAKCFIGGKSMGGRIASRIAARSRARGLICLGYPFHPTGKPDKLRIDHLQDLACPTLIVQGTRDAFGKRAEVESYPLSDDIHFHWLEGGDHSFKPTKRSGHTLEAHLQSAIEAIVGFMEAQS